MLMNKKIDISLLLALLIPVAMILFVAGSIYLPGLFIHPKYNFIYYNEGSYYSIRYIVKNGELIKLEPTEEQKKYNYNNGIEPKLFEYNVVKNESKEVSFDYARMVALDSNFMSPDGFTVEYGNGGESFFPFFFYSGTDYNARYLKGHNVSKKINIQTDVNNRNFRLLGWIK